MKKKLLSLALACGMVFSLAACGTPANNDSPAPNTLFCVKKLISFKIQL